MMSDRQFHPTYAHLQRFASFLDNIDLLGSCDAIEQCQPDRAVTPLHIIEANNHGIVVFAFLDSTDDDMILGNGQET
jgi:hypothetical protein